MLLKDRSWVPGIPLDVFLFMFSYSAGIPVLSLKFLAGTVPVPVKLLRCINVNALRKSLVSGRR